RPSSVALVAAEAEAFLDGAEEKRRRREEAIKLCRKAAVPVQRQQELSRDREQLQEDARKLLRGVQGYDAVEKKKAAWELEDHASAVERMEALSLAEAVDLYTKALAYDPELVDARQGLADLYWSRAVLAERQRQEATRVYYEALVAEFDTGKR